MPIETAGLPTLDPEHLKMLLDERARILAEPITEERDTSDDIDVVIFTLGPERFAIECRFVRAIAKAAGLMPIPGTPGFVAGALRIRGEIHAVFSLTGVLGGQRQAAAPDAQIVALGEQRIEFCLIVDSVAEITTVQLSEIHARAEDQDGTDRFFIRGITSDTVQVIDGAALLQHQSLYIGNAAHISIAKGSLP